MTHQIMYRCASPMMIRLNKAISNNYYVSVFRFFVHFVPVIRQIDKNGCRTRITRTGAAAQRACRSHFLGREARGTKNQTIFSFWAEKKNWCSLERVLWTRHVCRFGVSVTAACSYSYEVFRVVFSVFFFIRGFFRVFSCFRLIQLCEVAAPLELSGSTAQQFGSRLVWNTLHHGEFMCAVSIVLVGIGVDWVIPDNHLYYEASFLITTTWYIVIPSIELLRTAG